MWLVKTYACKSAYVCVLLGQTVIGQSKQKITSEELTERNREVWKKDDVTLVKLNTEGERTWINTH